MIIERSIEEKKTEIFLIKFIRSLSLSFKKEEKYKFVHLVEYITNKGKVYVGAGKGKYCYIGALAEMIEHYFMENYKPFKKKGKKLNHHYKNIQDFFLSQLEMFGGDLYVITLKDIISSKKILLPVEIINPFINYNLKNTEAYNFIKRYSTNSGTAFGMDKKDSFIHAIQEIYERHYLSNIFTKLISCEYEDFEYVGDLKNSNISKFLEIDNINYPDAFIIQKKHYKEDIFYFFAVVEKNKNDKLTIIGSGCSTKLFHALERACYEYIQLVFLSNKETMKEDNIYKTLLHSSSKLYPLINCYNVINFEKKQLQKIEIDYTPVNEIYQTIINYLMNNKILVFTKYKKLSILKKYGFICQCYIPNMNRFNLIRQGNYVVPIEVFSKKDE